MKLFPTTTHLSIIQVFILTFHTLCVQNGTQFNKALLKLNLLYCILHSKRDGIIKFATHIYEDGGQVLRRCGNSGRGSVHVQNQKTPGLHHCFCPSRLRPRGGRIGYCAAGRTVPMTASGSPCYGHLATIEQIAAFENSVSIRSVDFGR